MKRRGRTETHTVLERLFACCCKPDPRLDEIVGMLKLVLAREKRIMSQQEDLNALVDQMGGNLESMDASIAEIQAELSKPDEEVDLTALRAGMARFDASTGILSNLVPDPVADPVDPPVDEEPPADEEPPVDPNV